MTLLWQLELSLIQAVSDVAQIIQLSYCFTALTVTFTQTQFTGSEAERFVEVNVELDGGTSASEFDVTITPSEQSPVSAEGNNVMCVLLCVD